MVELFAAALLLVAPELVRPPLAFPPALFAPSVLVPTGPVLFKLFDPMSPAGGSGEVVFTCSVAELVLALLLLLPLLAPPQAVSASTLTETRAIEMVFIVKLPLCDLLA